MVSSPLLLGSDTLGGCEANHRNQGDAMSWLQIPRYLYLSCILFLSKLSINVTLQWAYQSKNLQFHLVAVKSIAQGRDGYYTLFFYINVKSPEVSLFANEYNCLPIDIVRYSKWRCLLHVFRNFSWPVGFLHLARVELRFLSNVQNDDREMQKGLSNWSPLVSVLSPVTHSRYCLFVFPFLVPVTCLGSHETADWPCFVAKAGKESTFKVFQFLLTKCCN